MTPGVETAYAKINLALHVRRRRADGYHDIETVFAFCEHGDAVAAEPSETLSLTIGGPFADALDAEGDNLVLRAARALGATAALTLTKNLPVASGLGGGSADAAATLRLLGGGRDLTAIAAALGADVPACLAATTLRGEARGDALTPAAPVTGTPILLVNPRVAVSTAAVFARWDGVDRGALGDWRDGRNDLEAPARAIAPAIGDVLEWLGGQAGVVLARMSGSGATCFALFESREARDAASDRLRVDRPGYWLTATTLR